MRPAAPPSTDRARGRGVRVGQAFTLAAAFVLSGCATGSDGLQSGIAAPDSGLAGLWGGALDSVPGLPAGGALLVTTVYDNALLFVDAVQGRPFARARVGFDPSEIATSFDRRQASVVNPRGDQFDLGSISVVSLEFRNETDRLDLYPYGDLDGLAPARDRVHLYVASGARNSILEVNLISRQVDRAFTLSGVPHLVALDPTETRLFVTDRSGPYVHSVDLTSGAVTRVRVGGAPEAVVVSPDGFSVWVACRDDGTVVVLDAATLAPRATLLSGRGPLRIAFTPDGDRALVVNSGESSVTVFDARALARIASIPVASTPVAIAIDGTGRRAYVACARDDRASVIELSSNLEIARIPIGQAAVSMAWATPP